MIFKPVLRLRGQPESEDEYHDTSDSFTRSGCSVFIADVHVFQVFTATLLVHCCVSLDQFEMTCLDTEFYIS